LHRCICYTPYTGAFCQGVALQTVTVGPNQFSTQTLYPGEWAYVLVVNGNDYSLDLTTNQVNISVTTWRTDTENESDPGCIFLYSQEDILWDELSEYDSDTNSNETAIYGNGTFQLVGALIDSGSVIISVARPFGSLTPCTYQLQVLAGCTYCHHGTCDTGTGKCNCNPNWTGATCDDKLEIVSVTWMIVSSISSFIIGLATMAIIWRIHTHLERRKFEELDEPW